MTLRERIADWISGGSITAWRMFEFDQRMKANEYLARLDEIRAEVERQRAPNAVVRRIGRMARGEE